MKGGHIIIGMYYMIKGASFNNLADHNGCSLFHWGAYNNDVKLLLLLFNRFSFWPFFQGSI